jgi:type I restriction enzyme S subunit
MNNWPRVPIGSVAEIFDGPHATPRTVDAGPIFLGIGALQNGRINLGETRHVTAEDFKLWTRRVRPQQDDVVFSYETRIGQAAIIPGRFECCLGRRMALVRTKRHRLHPKFFLYAYLSPEFQEVLRSRTIPGATVDRIALKEFPNFLIPLPPMVEQEVIAAILAAIDDKIDLNRRMNETLEAMARAIFRDWFVDFGPTRAKMEGRPPYLAADLWSLFPDRLNEAGKPDGWAACDLGSIANLNPPERLPQGTEAPYLDMAALPVRGSWPDKPIIRKAGSGARFKNGDTLLARITPCLENGKSAFVSRLEEQAIAWGSTEFIVIRPRSPFPPHYGYLLARDDAFRAYAIQSMTGTSGRQRVQPEALRAFPVTRPGDQVLRSFGNMVADFFGRIAVNEVEAETLAATRDLLLPKLMSGELRVREAEKIAEAVL